MTFSDNLDIGKKTITPGGVEKHNYQKKSWKRNCKKQMEKIKFQTWKWIKPELALICERESALFQSLLSFNFEKDKRNTICYFSISIGYHPRKFSCDFCSPVHDCDDTKRLRILIIRASFIAVKQRIWPLKESRKTETQKNRAIIKLIFWNLARLGFFFCVFFFGFFGLFLMKTLNQVSLEGNRL